MRKTFLLTIFFMLLFSSSMLYASCNCDTNEPDWYMDEEPYCQIFPHYYRVDITASESWHRENEDPEDILASGYCTEYWSKIDGSIGSPFSCGSLQSTYSPDSNNNLLCTLFTNSGCYGFFPLAGLPNGCNTPGLNISGSWNDKTHSGNGCYAWENNDDSYEYLCSSTVTAVFSRPPEECLSKPVVRISDYEKTMFVRPKCGGCCKYNGAQTITVSCNQATHTVITHSGLGGELVHPNSAEQSVLTGCSEDNHVHSGSITIIPNHDKVLNVEGAPKSQTVTYTVKFYDSAGNNIGTGNVNVTLKINCPKEAE